MLPAKVLYRLLVALHSSTVESLLSIIQAVQLTRAVFLWEGVLSIPALRRRIGYTAFSATPDGTLKVGKDKGIGF